MKKSVLSFNSISLLLYLCVAEEVNFVEIPTSFNAEETTQQDVTVIRSHEKCHWGTPECHYVAPVEENSSDAKAFLAVSKGSSKSDSPLLLSMSSDIQQQQQQHHQQQQQHQQQPKAHSSLLAYQPPEGFTLAAHIVTDPISGHSYFEDSTPRTIPYQECGALGSTTQVISMKHAYFRHFPQSAHPSTWSTSQHPKLVVALSRLEITVSGKVINNTIPVQEEEEEEDDDNDDDEDCGETRIFEPGQVILMEDWNPKGHKMRAAPSPDHSNDLQILILVPHSATTIGHSFSKGKQTRPCGGPDWGDGHNSTLVTQNAEDAMNRRSSLFQSTNTARRLGLGLLGVTLSSAMTYFLSKVAPLQLAVGVGGTCLIAGGTWGIIQGGEWICDEFKNMMESKRLERISTS